MTPPGGSPGRTLPVRNADVLVTMDGRAVIEGGHLCPVDLGSLVGRHNRLARTLVAG